MSQMKDRPVLFCKRCGRAYTFTLSTTAPDQEAKQLYTFMDDVLKDHLCAACTAAKSWYINQNRLPEWEAGAA